MPTRLHILLVAVAVLWVVAFVARAGDPTSGSAVHDDTAPREAVLVFIDAIDRLDLDGVANCFAEDAVAFYPFSFTPQRLEGRDAIREAQAEGFEWAREQLAAAGAPEPYSLGLQPTDMQVRMIGDDAALVTWHSNRPTHTGRRSAVLERVEGRWIIVGHHASNLAKRD